jgi:hypothetical protein
MINGLNSIETIIMIGKNQAFKTPGKHLPENRCLGIVSRKKENIACANCFCVR